MVRCPYCGKKLEDWERYCVQCEQDISEVRDEEDKPKFNDKKNKR